MTDVEYNPNLGQGEAVCYKDKEHPKTKNSRNE